MNTAVKTSATSAPVMFAILVLAMACIRSAVAAPQELRTQDFTVLREQPSATATQLGILNASASVILLEPAQTGWQKVQVDNGAQGYVRSADLTAHPMGADRSSVPEPFTGAGEGYGSAHMSVTVAGLKARTSPSSSKVACILTMGQSVGVDYVPVAQDEWVKLSGECAGTDAYVQRKFLGKRPEIQSLFAQFDALPESDLATRRTMAERAVELAWILDNEYRDVTPALKRFLSVAQALNDAQLIENTEVDLLVADSLLHARPETELIREMSRTKVKETMAGLHGNEYKVADIKRVLGAPNKISPNGDECGVYMGSQFYEYPQAVFDVDSAKGKAYLLSMKFVDEGSAIELNQLRLDRNTTERAFLKQMYGKFSASPTRSPHSYSLQGDAETFNFTFRNGVLYEYSYFAMC